MFTTTTARAIFLCLIIIFGGAYSPELVELIFEDTILRLQTLKVSFYVFPYENTGEV